MDFETAQPLIGSTTYRKVAAQSTPIPLMALMPTYSEGVSAGGGIPVHIPLGLDEASLSSLLARLDGLILTGGGDVDPSLYNADTPDYVRDIDTDRDRVELFLARQAIATGKPVLAICRGHQVLNVALGGTLFLDVERQMTGAIKHDYFGDFPRNYLPHTVEVEPESRLAAVLGANSGVTVNSLHHQGIRDLAPDLVVTAYAPDGLIEAVEVPDHPFAIAVQWHPENLIHDDPRMLALFQGLVQAAASQVQTVTG